MRLLLWVSVIACWSCVASAQQSTSDQSSPPNSRLAPEPSQNPPLGRTSVPHRVFYYRPGDLKGIPYDTIEGCWNAVQRAENVGICIMK